jgi:hypothetical protein
MTTDDRDQETIDDQQNDGNMSPSEIEIQSQNNETTQDEWTRGEH